MQIFQHFVTDVILIHSTEKIIKTTEIEITGILLRVPNMIGNIL